MRIYNEVDLIQQTGFQSACSEFAQKTLSIDERLDVGNPARKILELGVDAPLFGFKKDDKLLIDISLPVKANDLVIGSRNGQEPSVYRVEVRHGQKLIWPSMLALNDDEGLVCFKIVSLIREFIPPAT